MRGAEYVASLSLHSSIEYFLFKGADSEIKNKNGDTPLHVAIENDAYSAAKMALNSAVKAIAKEIARRDQRVNTVLPGWVNTAMTQNAADIVDMEPILKRHLLGIGKPEQVSGQVLFLLNNRAAWITGTNVVVDGGYLA